MSFVHNIIENLHSKNQSVSRQGNSIYQNIVKWSNSWTDESF